jgi:hypothetical protein
VEGPLASGIDNCALGLMCWHLDASGAGTCENLCTGSTASPLCDDPDEACFVTDDDPVLLCLDRCDPMLQDCPAGEGCYPNEDHFVCVSDGSGDAGAHGDPCDVVDVCDPGTACIEGARHSACTGDFGCCANFCDASDPAADADCAARDPAQSCERWFAAAQTPPGQVDVGVCAIAVG